MSNKIIINPYENVNWESWHKLEVDTHCHTILSDGNREPHNFIDEHHNNRDALTMTDHDTGYIEPYLQEGVTGCYPWTELASIYNDIKEMEATQQEGETYEDASEEPWEDRNPDNLDMVAYPGVEASAIRHMNYQFCQFHAGENNNDVEYILDNVSGLEGLAHFVHPGRYTDDDPEDDLVYDYYLPLYKKYDCLNAIEIFNWRVNHANDEYMWDNLLDKLLPQKPIWGIAGSDTHGGYVHYTFTEFVLSDKTQEELKEAFRCGSYFAKNNRQDTNEYPDIPDINSIDVNGTEITIDAETYDKIEWVQSKEVIETGDTINIENLSGHYVRARVINEGEYDEGRCYTQPIVFTPEGMNATEFKIENGNLIIETENVDDVEVTIKKIHPLGLKDIETKTTLYGDSINYELPENCYKASVVFKKNSEEIKWGEIENLTDEEEKELRRKAKVKKMLLL